MRPPTSLALQFGFTPRITDMSAYNGRTQITNVSIPKSQFKQHNQHIAALKRRRRRRRTVPVIRSKAHYTHGVITHDHTNAAYG